MEELVSRELEGPGGSATTRRSFLRKLGKFAAVGLGVALVPARLARAAPLESAHCCQSACKSCSSGNAYTCYDCPIGSCCICINSDASCIYQLGCGVC